MTAFAARLTRCPIPHDPAQGMEAAAAFAGLAPELRELIAGTAGCSPYLRHLMEREAGWLTEALTGAPEAAAEGVFTGLPAREGDPGPALRQAKRRIALLAALADLGGVWPLEAVTGWLTRLADTATDLALKAALEPELRRGRVPGATMDDLATAAGVVALAMGKTGAGELNYSSDIDLILLFDETRYPDTAAEARAAFVRAVRKMTATLSDNTAEGYVFRTDLRLRPDASVTPVCLSMAAAEAYYESVGRTWERAAYIKARAAAGDIAAGERFLATLTPFVWRKHLDFTTIQDTQDMRRRIHDHRGLHGRALEGRNIKLGPGGIREIEFFAQTRQLIAGGRDPALRDRTTVGALAALARAGWVPAEVTERLTTLYRAHREVEHRLQMIADAQTHDLPSSAEGFERLARFCGEGDTARWIAGLRERLEEVSDLTEDFFAPPGSTAEAPAISEHAQQIVEGWNAYPALRSARAREIFARLRPEILARMTRAADPEAALREFDGFLRGLPAGVQLFSLFAANPQLIELILDICATAPRLAAHLARHASVLDAVIGGSFFAPWPGEAALRVMLSDRMAEEEDYERKLDAARRWAKEWHFRIGVHHLRGLIDAFEAGKCYADLADAVVGAVWAPVLAEFARKHGAPPGEGAVVLGMGSLGAGRLNAASDLDLIVIYEAGGVEASDGPRPLAARAYYARLTQALLTAISAPMAEGRLYEVDMRLRPSGRAGPVATSFSAFTAYQRDEAWTWEHLALTRARVLAGPAVLAGRVEEFRRDLLAEKAGGEKIARDVGEMRARLRAARPGSTWDAKLGPGRLQDIELLAQTCALRAGDPARRVEAQLRAALRQGLLTGEEEAVLLRAYRLCWRLTAAARLLTDGPFDPAAIGEGATAFLLRETEAGDAERLAAALVEATAAAALVIDRHLPLPAGERVAGGGR